MSEIKTPEVQKEVEKFPPLIEKTLFLFLDPGKSSNFLISNSEPQSLLSFTYQRLKDKSLTLKQSINKFLSETNLFEACDDLYDKLELVCVSDFVHAEVIYRVFITKHRITLNEEQSKLYSYVPLKALTKKSNPDSKVFLKAALHCCSDLEIINYFKPY